MNDRYLDRWLRAELKSVKVWPGLGCWPESTPGSGCCGPGCGSGGMESPVGRWCTAGCIHPGHRRDWAGSGAASGTDPKFPKNSLLHRIPALFWSEPQRFTNAWTFSDAALTILHAKLVWECELGRKIKKNDSDVHSWMFSLLQLEPLLDPAATSLLIQGKLKSNWRGRNNSASLPSPPIFCNIHSVKTPLKNYRKPNL